MTTTIPPTESGTPPAEAGHSPLETARRAIDALDDTLLALIEQRFALSLKVAALKQTLKNAFLILGVDAPDVMTSPEAAAVVDDDDAEA